MRIAVAQINPVVGDVHGNVRRMADALTSIDTSNVDLVVYPELVLSGYPPRDLITFRWFLDLVEDGVEELLELSQDYPNLGILFGTPRRNGNTRGKGLANAALLIQNGEILLEQHKWLLPTYDVFDELRYFDSGGADHYHVVEFAGETLGVGICEDAWNDPEFEQTLIYADNPIQYLADHGATLLINITASPYNLHKEVNRFERNGFHARKHGVPFLSVCQVGANDELIFDGRSNLCDREGRLIELLPAFEADVRVVDTAAVNVPEVAEDLPELESLRRALVLGLKDYMRKCGFKHAVIGLSGGIDSALTACIAVDALGAENVRGVTMPSHISSSGSVDDSVQLAKNLGIRCDTVPIAPIFNSFNDALAEPFAGLPPNVTEENLQARIRGTLLMAFSNKTGALLLTTGNKSELAVGYCTLYGDMDGGLAVISDLLKTNVYRLARWYNRDHEIIPDIIITKAPSAELAPDQKDQDTLPEYDILDGILAAFLEEGAGPEEIVARGYDREIVEWVVRTVQINEYKRWQAAPGLRVSQKAFGAGRRMPIAARVSWKK